MIQLTGCCFFLRTENYAPVNVFHVVTSGVAGLVRTGLVELIRWESNARFTHFIYLILVLLPRKLLLYVMFLQAISNKFLMSFNEFVIQIIRC